MSLTVQFQSMLAMVAMGIYLGMAVDTYSRLLKGRKWNSWITIINDIIFWVLQGLLTFYLLLQINEGEMRFYLLIALLTGYTCYRALLFQVYLKMLEAIILIVLKSYHFIKTTIRILVINPTKGLLKLLYTVCMMIVSFLLTVIFFLLKLIYTPFLWLFKGIWRLLPNKKVKKFKNKLGFFNKMKNVIKSWFRKDQD